MSPCPECHEYECNKCCGWSEYCEDDKCYLKYKSKHSFDDDTYRLDYNKKSNIEKHVNCNVNKCCGGHEKHKIFCIFNTIITLSLSIEHDFEYSNNLRKCRNCGLTINLKDYENLCNTSDLKDIMKYCYIPFIKDKKSKLQKKIDQNKKEIQRLELELENFNDSMSRIQKLGL